MNSVILTGNLATDPAGKKIVVVRDGQRAENTIASFLLAVNRPRRNGQDDPGADFVRVEVWGKGAENALQYLKKGRRVNIEGRLRSSRWTTQDGQVRYDLRVVARRIEYWPVRTATNDQAETAQPAFEPAEEAEFDRVPF